MTTPQAWTTVRNMGPASAQRLEAIGLADPAVLSTLGPVEIYLRLCDAYPGQISRIMLWALAGAELDLDWRELPSELREQLLAQVAESAD
ncbi:hypothetical protein GCM10027417_28090 [Glutamicibacter endophyticus]